MIISSLFVCCVKINGGNRPRAYRAKRSNRRPRRSARAAGSAPSAKAARDGRTGGLGNLESGIGAVEFGVLAAGEAGAKEGVLWPDCAAPVPPRSMPRSTLPISSLSKVSARAGNIGATAGNAGGSSVALDPPLAFPRSPHRSNSSEDSVVSDEVSVPEAALEAIAESSWGSC